jgi:hypothetical protein
MNPIDLLKVQACVEEHIAEFHNAKLKTLERLKLHELLKRKNPYLFRAKNLNSAPDLIEHILTAFLSSSEEELFGKFLEKLAIFVASQTMNVLEHDYLGIDTFLETNNTYYLMQIKSGPNWGNNSQQNDLRTRFHDAKESIEQNNPNKLPVECILGICFGNKKFIDKHNYRTIIGQQFWHFISGNKQLYIELVKPIGYRAKEKNEDFWNRRAATTNLLIKQLIDDFCDTNGAIKWDTILEFNSKNMDD